MRQREKDAERCLTQIPHSAYCDIATSWGLSESVYIEREKQRLEKCKPETELWNSLKRKEWRDHPTFLQFEACVRNIMLGR